MLRAEPSQKRNRGRRKRKRVKEQASGNTSEAVFFFFTKDQKNTSEFVGERAGLFGAKEKWRSGRKERELRRRRKGMPRSDEEGGKRVERGARNEEREEILAVRRTRE